jgi:hypothetical protein
VVPIAVHSLAKPGGRAVLCHQDDLSCASRMTHILVNAADTNFGRDNGSRQLVHTPKRVRRRFTSKTLHTSKLCSRQWASTPSLALWPSMAALLQLHVAIVQTTAHLLHNPRTCCLEGVILADSRLMIRWEDESVSPLQMSQLPLLGVHTAQPRRKVQRTV